MVQGQNEPVAVSRKTTGEKTGVPLAGLFQSLDVRSEKAVLYPAVRSEDFSPKKSLLREPTKGFAFLII